MYFILTSTFPFCADWFVLVFLSTDVTGALVRLVTTLYQFGSKFLLVCLSTDVTGALVLH